MLENRSRLAQIILAVAVTGGFFLAYLIPVSHGVAPDQAMGQTLQNMFILVIGYYFGSSSSAAKKDDVIAAASVAHQNDPVKVDDSTPIKVKKVEEGI